MIDLNAMTFEVHSLARSKGFWDSERNIGELLMLVNSELAEALEEVRSGRSATEIYRLDDGKPLGFPIEMADAVIRIFDLCAGLGINLEAAIVEKHRYNLTREFKHGKEF